MDFNKTYNNIDTTLIRKKAMIFKERKREK